MIASPSLCLSLSLSLFLLLLHSQSKVSAAFQVEARRRFHSVFANGDAFAAKPASMTLAIPAIQTLAVPIAAVSASISMGAPLLARRQHRSRVADLRAFSVRRARNVSIIRMIAAIRRKVVQIARGFVCRF